MFRKKRRFKLVFCNVENAFADVKIDKESVKAKTSYENSQLTIEAEIDVSQEVLVDFGEELRQAQPCVQDEIKARLMPMKCEYALKSRIYGLCRGGSKEQTICDVLAMDISEKLKYAVLEPVLRIV